MNPDDSMDAVLDGIEAVAVFAIPSPPTHNEQVSQLTLAHLEALRASFQKVAIAVEADMFKECAKALTCFYEGQDECEGLVKRSKLTAYQKANPKEKWYAKFSKGKGGRWTH